MGKHTINLGIVLGISLGVVALIIQAYENDGCAGLAQRAAS